ncbi:MAG: polynucleotide kinase-phosphatase [Cyanobacteria bacterium P01_F01_bin.150]
MKIIVPELAVVVLIGPSGSGKSTFAAKHFKPTEVLSSDYFRGLISDDENDQSVTNEAFAALHYIAAQRLAIGRLVVVDATNVQPASRKPLVALARKYHCIPVAIVLNTPRQECIARNEQRPDRNFGSHVIRNQVSQLKRSIRGLKREGFRHIYKLESLEDIEAAVIERQPLWNNKKDEIGPFDIIGDIHGCFDETEHLLQKLGYRVEPSNQYEFGKGYRVTHPEGRKIIFVGDLVDRGPKTPDVLRLAMSVIADSVGHCVPGNHDVKLVRKLRGKNVQIKYGLAETLEQLEKEPEEFHRFVENFLDGLISHYVFDGGKLVVAHAGMKEEYQGRGSGKVREFALYGETTGETDEFGLPIRYNWAAEYRGSATVVYGHTPVPEPEWLNRTINIDTGCVFGGRLTALRYPEKDIVAVDAAQMYAEPVKPIVPQSPDGRSMQQQHDDLLDLEDVSGKLIISTKLRSNVTIREENATAALEVMSRFALNPKWLIYLPPTMSPSETSTEDGFLEHPREALSYFEKQGVEQLICEEKHMGSRAVVVVCKDRDAAVSRFGVADNRLGVCYTRTGRSFFNDDALEENFITRVNEAVTKSGLWEELSTDWLCLDCELMPWSVKAQDLLKQQYAAVGAASQAALGEVSDALTKAQNRGIDVGNLLNMTEDRRQMAAQFVEAYQAYCWPVHSLNDLKLAPFQILASEGNVHTDQNHLWHMNLSARMCNADPDLFRVTRIQVVDLKDETDREKAIQWWLAMTDSGGEGMVIKPINFIHRGRRGLIQPAVKCRGREYLRIIYGAEYTVPENLERLRKRGLSTKRSLALREFALGIEGLERFVNKEPLRRVHQCSFGVLALESEPVDPRL